MQRTLKATKWAHGNFTQWKLSRNRRFACEPDKQVPEKLLECAYDPGVVSKWLALYIAETRKENGDCYPPKTLYALLAGLLRYCQSKNPTCHSLRATGASTMFESGVPEKIIQQRTGHRSLEGLRHYEQTTMQQQQAVCNVLASEKRESFQLSVRKNTQQLMPMNAPQMKFAGCNVTIHQGTAPAPTPTQSSGSVTGLLDGLDIDAFFAD